MTRRHKEEAPEKKMTIISVRIGADVRAALAKRARLDDRTLSQFIRRLLNQAAAA